MSLSLRSMWLVDEDFSSLSLRSRWSVDQHLLSHSLQEVVNFLLFISTNAFIRARHYFVKRVKKEVTKMVTCWVEYALFHSFKYTFFQIKLIYFEIILQLLNVKRINLNRMETKDELYHLLSFFELIIYAFYRRLLICLLKRSFPADTISVLDIFISPKTSIIHSGTSGQQDFQPLFQLSAVFSLDRWFRKI